MGEGERGKAGSIGKRAGRWLPALLSALLWSLLWTGALCLPAQAQRVALVIGNGAYTTAPLKNPANDAQAMAQALRDAGFDVVLQRDAGYRDMLGALRAFGERLRGSGGVGVFYFAGHGMQIKGRNYLIPVDADIHMEDEVPYQSLDAQAVLDKMESAGNGMNLVILDACRNNPFVRSVRSGGQGLAQMDAPVGTLVAFATSPGAIASDGNGEHGLYTLHLLEAVRQPGLKVEEVFKQVRTNVRRDSKGKQVPWEATSLEGDFYFHPAGAVQVAMPAPVPAPVAAPVSVRASAEPAQDAVQTAALAPNRLASQAETDRLLDDMQRWGAQDTQRRPAAPRRNAHGVAEGDRFRYQVLDVMKRGEPVAHYLWRVDRIEDDGSLVVNDGAVHLDAMGLLDRPPAAPVPGLLAWVERPALLDGPMAAGQRHGVRGVLERPDAWGRMDHLLLSGAATVDGLERVDTPAGSFEAWRVEGFLLGARGWNVSATVWWAPGLGMWVAMEEVERIDGRPSSWRRHELMAVDALALARR